MFLGVTAHSSPGICGIPLLTKYFKRYSKKRKEKKQEQNSSVRFSVTVLLLCLQQDGFFDWPLVVLHRAFFGGDQLHLAHFPVPVRLCFGDSRERPINSRCVLAAEEDKVAFPQVAGHVSPLSSWL